MKYSKPLALQELGKYGSFCMDYCKLPLKYGTQTQLVSALQSVSLPV